MPLGEDAQGGQQFLAEEVGAIIVLGEGGERMDGIVAAHEAAEIGFHAPDRQHHLRLDAIALLRAAQRLRPFLAHGPALGRLRIGDTLFDILLHGLGEFGLLARQLHDLGTGAVASKGGLEYLAADAIALGISPEAAHKAGRIGKGGQARGHADDKRQGSGPESGATDRTGDR